MMLQAQGIEVKRYHVVLRHKRDKSLRVEIWAESELDALPHELYYQERGFEAVK